MNLANLAISPDWVWLSLSAVTVLFMFRLFFAAVRFFVKAMLTVVTLAILFYFASNYFKQNDTTKLQNPWAIFSTQNGETTRGASAPL